MSEKQIDPVSSGTPTVDLAAIKRRRVENWGRLAFGDTEVLIAEVERLRAALSALSGQTAPQETSMKARIAELEWVLNRAEEIVCYEHGKVAAYSFTQAWGELPKDMSTLSSASTPEIEGSEQQQNETTKI